MILIRGSEVDIRHRTYPRSATGLRPAPNSTLANDCLSAAEGEVRNDIPQLTDIVDPSIF
jgi:hypothetical protein